MTAIAIIGAGGALGGALLAEAETRFPGADLHAFSRSPAARGTGTAHWHAMDVTNEASVKSAAESVPDAFDMVIVATGMLHQGDVQPEKSLRDVSAEAMEQLLRVNTIAPALVMKHFLPKLRRDQRAVFAALSARVGSISDNRLGGWYSYRASKAALNMLLKTASIEMGRKNKSAVVVGLHPGTVDSGLSKPFQRAVPEGKLFTPAYSARCLMDVLVGVTPADTGKLFDYAGHEIAF